MIKDVTASLMKSNLEARLSGGLVLKASISRQAPPQSEFCELTDRNLWQPGQQGMFPTTTFTLKCRAYQRAKGKGEGMSCMNVHVNQSTNNLPRPDS